MCVHLHPPAVVKRHPCLLQAQVASVGAAADGDEHDVRLDPFGLPALRRLDGQRHAVVAPHRTRHLGGQAELDSLLAQHALECLGDLRVHAGH